MFKQEFITLIRPELERLIKDHWEEVAVNKSKIKLNPDWDVYEGLEKLGHIKLFTFRDSCGELAGYFAVTISTSLHYKDHLFATNDVIYIDQAYRKSGAGSELIKFAEGCLKEDGVSVLNINTKVHKPFGKLLEYLGFTPVEMVYSKYIGE